MPTWEIRGTEAAPQTQVFAQPPTWEVERSSRHGDWIDQETTTATLRSTSGFRGEDTFLSAGAASPPQEILAAFVEALACTRSSPEELPDWWLSLAMQRCTGHCAYCGIRLRTALVPSMDVIIPIMAGGPRQPDALVMCCKACKQAKGRRDLILWKPDAPPLVRELRMRLSLKAWNHVSRDALLMQTEAATASLIAKRWLYPRFHCHAVLIPRGGFIGWRVAALVPTAIQLRLVFELGGVRLRTPMKNANRRLADAIIFWFPTQKSALDAIWDLIDHNGLVRRVDLPQVEPALEVSDPQRSEDWALIFPTIADLIGWREMDGFQARL